MANWVSAEESMAQYGTPAYTGWGKAEAEADFRAKGGGSVGNSGGGSDFASLFGQIAGSPVEIPPLNVRPIEDYEKDALEELRPYYERILKEEGGDVEKAKARIEEDYNRGIRVTRQDWETAKTGQGTPIRPGESIADYYNRAKNEYGTFSQEGIQAVSNLNKRGILSSGIANVSAANLATDQQRRQQALDLAMQRYEEQSGITRGRNIEDTNTAWDRKQFDLGEEKKVRAAQMARQNRSDDVATQQIERENLMRKAITNIYG